LDFIIVCPELEIGLGTPRSPINVYIKDGKKRLIQRGTGKDLTEIMEKFTNNFVEALGDIDGIILKSGSPSCGIKNTKIYDMEDEEKFKNSGIFAQYLREKYSYLPFITETDIEIKAKIDNFIVQIYTWARFRKSMGSYDNLKKFHMRNRLTLMSFEKKGLFDLDQIISEGSTLNFGFVEEQYFKFLKDILKTRITREKRTHVFLKIFNFIESALSQKKSEFLRKMIEEYLEGNIECISVLKELKKFIDFYNYEELSEQTFFHLYPRELMLKNIWK
jgi:uncharacterized protein YbbK (DUF523 family)/uncharacterized protein YbgA (DUF1722 family)